MIVNRTSPETPDKLRNEILQSTVARTVCEALDRASTSFEVITDASGFEARAIDPLPSGLPNRARIRVFSPRPGHTLIFFYKKSLVPYSRDRYSYGGVDLKDGELNPQEIGEWIEFASSGFHPEKRPARLRRAFPYEIPE